MYNSYKLALKYLTYWLKASNGKGHGIHSPFVFEFITRVMNDEEYYAEYKKGEALREHFLRDKNEITVQDFGAGSAILHNKNRSIRSIAKSAAKPRKYAQLLFRMARYYQPEHILELGTSLGITTNYLSLARPAGKIITMEGAPEIARVAGQHFMANHLQNISLIPGNFDDTLQDVLQQLRTVDFAFIDGNHRKDPTLKYFLSLLPHIQNHSILVFDDIHWSSEMEEAWKIIREHPLVRCTIDLFFIGIVVFRMEFREKQHFTIRF
ncbi:MAG TPA: class I SAM-dependent methyltransferase [Chitinophagaceae bacterium]|nr:class I SAM-dependent methyltransferase [Chitinophagaceae bacterium]